MQKEKKNWSQYEDNALKTLRDIRKVEKWSQIAKLLEEQFEVKGKNGKRCRQRYHNHLSSEVKKQVWTEEEQVQLLELHNEKGNKWAEIAKLLGRSDNAVKNHYHSKLRKGIRRINYRISAHFKNQLKPLRNNIISKIVQTTQKIYYTDNDDKKRLAQACFEMKNNILQQAKDSQNLTQQQIQNLKRLVVQINAFNRNFKKKSKKNEKPEIHSARNPQNLFKNSHSDSSAENLQQNSDSSQEMNEESKQLQNQNEDQPQESRKPSMIENKRETRTFLQRQQPLKKYELRRERTRQFVKFCSNIEHQGKIMKDHKREVLDYKTQCKTPEIIEEPDFNNNVNFNSMMNLGFISPVPANFSYYNFPTFSPTINSFGSLGENEKLEFYRNSFQNSFDYLMFSPGNYMWTFNSHLESENGKNVFSRANDNFISQKGFVPFQKEDMSQDKSQI